LKIVLDKPVLFVYDYREVNEMIKLHGTVEIAENISISGFTFEYPGPSALVPLILIGQKEAISWAKKKLKQAEMENKKAIRELARKP
jgi:hypothetical protein